MKPTPKLTKVEQSATNLHGYEGWNTYTIQDAKTNVCLAVVGEIDRYFQDEYGEIARRLSTAYNLVPEFVAVLELACRYLENPEVQAVPFALPASAPLERARELIKKAKDAIP